MTFGQIETVDPKTSQPKEASNANEEGISTASISPENQASSTREGGSEPVTKIVHVHYHYVIHSNDPEKSETSPPPIGICSDPMSELKPDAVVAISTDVFPNNCLDNLQPRVGETVENGQWLVKKTEKGYFQFSSLRRKQSNNQLRIGRKGTVSCDGGTGEWAQFKVESTGGSQISIQSVGNEEEFGRKWYLAVDESTGDLVGNSTEPYPFFLISVETKSSVIPSKSKQVSTDTSDQPRKREPKSEGKLLREMRKQEKERRLKQTLEKKDARTLLQPGKVVVLCSFDKEQNRKRSEGWHLGVSPTGMLVPDAGQSSWGQWKVEFPDTGGSSKSPVQTDKENATSDENLPSRPLCFSSIHTPKWHLRVNSDGRVSPKGEGGRHAQFKPIFHANGRVSFQCVAHGDDKPNRDGGKGWCLAVMEDGNIVGNADASQLYAQFLVQEAPKPLQQQQQQQQPGNDKKKEGTQIPLRFVGRTCKYGPRFHRQNFRSPHKAEEVVAVSRLSERVAKAKEMAASLAEQANADKGNLQMARQAELAEKRVQKLMQQLEQQNKSEVVTSTNADPESKDQDSTPSHTEAESTAPDETRSEQTSKTVEVNDMLEKIRAVFSSDDEATKQKFITLLNSLST